MNEEAADSTVTFDGVTKEYGSILAVDDFSLSVGGGQYHCLLGPNGSGKSTVLRLLLGLARPTSGTITRSSAVLGCGFQQPNFYPDLTARENVEVFAGLVGVDDSAWTRRVLEELRLERALDRRAGDLSAGFARKLDLALALLKRPDVLVLDEPLGTLDDITTARLLSFLEEYAGEGRTVLVATHRVTAFEPSIDRVSVLHRGHLVFDRAVEQVDLGDHESLQSYYVDAVLARENAE